MTVIFLSERMGVQDDTVVIDVVNGLVVEVVKVSILVVFLSNIVGVVGCFVIDVYSGIDVVGRILSVVCYEAH